MRRAEPAAKRCRASAIGSRLADTNLQKQKQHQPNNSKTSSANTKCCWCRGAHVDKQAGANTNLCHANRALGFWQELNFTTGLCPSAGKLKSDFLGFGRFGCFFAIVDVMHGARLAESPLVLFDNGAGGHDGLAYAFLAHLGLHAAGGA